MECVVRNEPVRHRNQQLAPIDPNNDDQKTIFFCKLTKHTFGIRADARIAIQIERLTS